MKNIWTILFAIGLCLMSFGHASADGGVFPSANYYVSETGQQALIYYHNKVEDLVVLPTYRGNSQNFTWVVPTPSKPSVSASSTKLFSQLRKLTQIDSGYYKANTADLSLSASSSTNDVQVIEEKTIDIFQTAIVKAASENALSDWMKENSYAFPEKSNYLLDSYVQQGWYFSLAKIRQEVKSSLSYSGQITPLRFTFNSDKIIYPMKLTKIAGSNDLTTSLKTGQTAPAYYSYPQKYSSVTTYVLADYKVKNDELNMEWADWIGSQKISDIATETGNDWLKVDNKKLFLTAFHQNYYYSKMNDDVIFIQATDNHTYPTPAYMTASYWHDFTKFFLITLAVFCLSPVVLLYIIVALLQKYEPQKNYHLKIIARALLPLVSTGVAFWWLSLESQNGLYQTYSLIFKNDGEITGVVGALFLGSFLLWLIMIIKFVLINSRYRSDQTTVLDRAV